MCQMPASCYSDKLQVHLFIVYRFSSSIFSLLALQCNSCNVFCQLFHWEYFRPLLFFLKPRTIVCACKLFFSLVRNDQKIDLMALLLAPFFFSGGMDLGSFNRKWRFFRIWLDHRHSTMSIIVKKISVAKYVMKICRLANFEMNNLTGIVLPCTMRQKTIIINTFVDSDTI